MNDPELTNEKQPKIKGPIRSALDHTRYAGGSIGGAAGCVGAGILPFAIANDSEG
jgi:Asp-tRNA(Asn)/Glu-tRNA(Gln) amidotransferase A subunit family amidase